jgi:hypothetical protein
VPREPTTIVATRLPASAVFLVTPASSQVMISSDFCVRQAGESRIGLTVFRSQPSWTSRLLRSPLPADSPS